jgi:transcriptional regulator with XRE-family HTH domain
VTLTAGPAPTPIRPASPRPTPAAADARRTELAAFLRACRSRITPEAVGIPPGPRRRTPGLRREEVAQLAGVGITWYTWLEQGRRINASEQVIDAIARSLKLDPDERDHLFRLAEVTSTAVRPSVRVPPEVQCILDAVDPLPASMVSARYDVLAWNEAYQALFPGVVAPGARRNTLWCTFSFPECCNPFVNRDTEAPRLVAMLRAGYGRHIGEPEWETFIAELCGVSPLFGELWARQQVSSQAASLGKVFRHQAVGEIRMTTTSLYLVAAPETRIVVYNPADEQSRERVAWLRAHPELPASDHVHPELRFPEGPPAPGERPGPG